jgi:hypothetical protein
VIVGLQAQGSKHKKILFKYPDIKAEPLAVEASNINGYLLDAPNVLIEARGVPIQSDVQPMVNGSKPTDAGFLSDISGSEAEAIRMADPVAGKYLRRLIGARELLNGGNRWCLWLVGAAPEDLRKSPELLRRVGEVRAMREASRDKQTQKDAATPSLFQKVRQPSATYLVVPCTSSATRKYVPMALFEPDTITNNAVLNVSNATLYTFGVLQSSVFMIWNAAVSGRLKSDYRISADITYNNFPWPENPKNRDAIEAAAQVVLDVREKYPTSSLADLYDPRSMPKDLVDAHLALDRLVLSSYGLKSDAAEADILVNLFERYVVLTADLLTELPVKKARKKKTD